MGASVGGNVGFCVGEAVGALVTDVGDAEGIDVGDEVGAGVGDICTSKLEIDPPSTPNVGIDVSVFADVYMYAEASFLPYIS